MNTHCFPQLLRQTFPVLQPIRQELVRSATSLDYQSESQSCAGLVLPFQKNRRWVALSQIVRLEGVGNYTNCHFVDGSQLLTALSLKVLADRLPEGAFLRTHRKHLLNRQYIETISSANATAVLTNGERIPVARRRTTIFREAYRSIRQPLRMLSILFGWLFGYSVMAQTEVPPTYSVDGRVNAMETYGDTLILGGSFGHIGKYTGGGALFSTASDEPILTFPKINGIIVASCPDGNGGFYIAGDYYRESETGSQSHPRIEHILPDYTFEAGFSLTVSAFRVNKLLFHNGLLYVGGWNLAHIGTQTASNLSVINVATQQVQTWLPTITLGTDIPEITNFMIARGTLYVLGNFTSVGGQNRFRAAAIAIGSGAVRAWNPSPNFDNPGYSDLLLYGNNIVVGGGLGAPGADGHAAAIVDTTNGSLIKYLFKSGGLFGNNARFLYWAAGISSLAIQGNTLFAYSWGTFDTRVTAIDLQLNAPYNVLWMKYFNMSANAPNMAVVGNSLYLGGGNFSEVYLTDSTNAKPANIERKVRNIVRLNTNTGNLENWFPDPVANNADDVRTIAVSGTNLFFGGRFSHMKGLDRAGLAMLRNSTQTVLPFQINDTYGYYTTVGALKIAGDTLFVAGGLQSVSTTQYSSIAAYKLGKGTRINWNPVNLDYVRNIAVHNNTVFVGGDLNEPSGGAGRTNLFAINRQTGNLNSWAPNPDRRVWSLHIRNGKLYVGGEFRNINAQARQRLVAYDLNSLSLTAWNPGPDGDIIALTSIPGTIWAGGYFSTIGGATRSIAASFNEQAGTVNSFPTFPPSIFGRSPKSLVPAGKYMLMAVDFSLSDNPACNNLMIYDMYNKVPLSTTAFCQNIEGRGVYVTAKVGNDWYFGGDINRVNGKTVATNIGRIRFPNGYFNSPDEYVTIAPGNWFDPTIWQVSIVPPTGTNVTINHRVSLPATVISRRVRYGMGGSINFSTGVSLKFTP